MQRDRAQEPYDAQTLLSTTGTAVLAEVVCAGSNGVPALQSVTPLLLDGGPAFTITLDRSDLAQELSGYRRVALVFSDPRMARLGWSPLATTAIAEVERDLEGEFFRNELLEQELRKFPPSRELASSFLLQRENWWYLPRWIVRLKNCSLPRPIGRRSAPDHGVLAWSCSDPAGAPKVDTVEVEDWLAGRIRLRSLSGDGALLESSGPAALFAHDFEMPGMDHRTTFTAVGRLRDSRLEVERRSGSPGLGKRPGLISRWRSWRALEKGCKAGIAGERMRSLDSL